LRSERRIANWRRSLRNVPGPHNVPRERAPSHEVRRVPSSDYAALRFARRAGYARTPAPSLPAHRIWMATTTACALGFRSIQSSDHFGIPFHCSLVSCSTTYQRSFPSHKSRRRGTDRTVTCQLPKLCGEYSHAAISAPAAITIAWALSKVARSMDQCITNDMDCPHPGGIGCAKLDGSIRSNHREEQSNEDYDCWYRPGKAILQR